MQKTILPLILAVLAALLGYFGVPRALEGVAQFGFFILLVVFIVLMISHLAEDR